MAIRLKRTGFPESLKGTCQYWFTYRHQDWGVSRAMWEGVVQWEIFDAEHIATVQDDFDTLRQLRREAANACDLFLADLDHERTNT